MNSEHLSCIMDIIFGDYQTGVFLLSSIPCPWYLGLPMVPGQLKSQDIFHSVEKMPSHHQRWARKFNDPQEGHWCRKSPFHRGRRKQTLLLLVPMVVGKKRVNCKPDAFVLSFSLTKSRWWRWGYNRCTESIGKPKITGQGGSNGILLQAHQGLDSDL